MSDLFESPFVSPSGLQSLVAAVGTGRARNGGRAETIFGKPGMGRFSARNFRSDFKSHMSVEHSYD